MPTPGDVDVVMAAELMEAGRSVLRGLVTPERTTLIASTHRAFAVVEKQAPGDGVADPAVVSLATEFAARRVIAFDMEAHREGARQRHFGDDVRRARRDASAPVCARGVRGGDPRGRDRRRGEPARLRRRLRPDAARIRSSRSGAFPRSGSRHGRRRPATPSSTAWGAHSVELSRIGATDAVRRRAPSRRLSRSRLTGSNISIASASCSTTIARMAGRRGASRSPSPPPNMSRSRWPMTTCRASPISRSALSPGARAPRGRRRRRCARDDDRVFSSARRGVVRLAARSDGASGSKARPRTGRALCESVVDRGRRIRPEHDHGLSDARRRRKLGAAARHRCAMRARARIARPGCHVAAAGVADAATNWASRFWLPAAGQGLFRHACARLVEVRSRDVAPCRCSTNRDDGAAWLDRLKRAALADENGAALDGVLKTIATL